ncbi:Klb [Phodopus roborovskii]|uniref:Klb protein n=1 Tax=Phodopus roborovskii TaxID=109678 RepID=A0AAU9ZUH6_PHORO|nr:Klb [Phodopus roborovskii]
MKAGCAAGSPGNEWIFFSSDERNTRSKKTMSIRTLQRSAVLSAFILLRAVSGFSGDGKAIWAKNQYVSPVNASQLFLYDTFPKNFFWGVGTGAFQVEGSWQADERGPSIWDHFIYTYLRDVSSIDKSADSYVFLEKDLLALDFLGVSFYQFSISWPRLFPDGTVAAVNAKGLQYYNELLDSLILRNIEPVVTLYHWDLPLALQEDYGGWKNAIMIELFNDYATYCFQTFGDRVKYWITIHNPYLVAWHGFGTGMHAPGEKGNLTAVYIVGHNLIKFDEIQVFGYTAWSLLDGFEWQYAYTTRRGLFYVDFNSEQKERKPKTSAHYYRQIIQENGFPLKESTPDIQGQFPCDFSWGVTESVLKPEFMVSSPQFTDPHLYVWNATGNRLLHRVEGVRLKTKPSHCTDYVSIKNRVEMLAKMKVTHYQFALDWASILPTGNLSEVNRQVLRYYRCVVSEGLKLGVSPMVTLYHPTHSHLGLPEPLLNSGGWLNTYTSKAFQDYAGLCFRELGDLVKLWITINEPNRLSDMYNRTSNDTYSAAHNLMIAHAQVWHLYDRQYRPVQHGAVSLSLHSDWVEPANPYVDSHWKAAERFLQFEIAWFADPLFKTGDYPVAMKEYIASKNHRGLSSSVLPRFTPKESKLVKGTIDFYALNHFTTRFVIHKELNSSRSATDRDVLFLQDVTRLRSPSHLAVMPWGARKLLGWIRKNYRDMDIYITANGIDDLALENDRIRKYYLEKYIQEALKAYLIDKVKIKGYYAFKLTEEKSKPRFGFFTSDFKAKSSVEFYSKLISSSGFPSETTSPACGQHPEDTECTICSFFTKKKPLIFFGCCFISTLALLLSITIFHHRKRRKFQKSKNLQNIPLKKGHSRVLS